MLAHLCVFSEAVNSYVNKVFIVTYCILAFLLRVFYLFVYHFTLFIFM